jgi:putative acetyltransferase
MRVVIREELPADREAVRQVNRLAFAGDAEAQLVDRLREGGYTEVSLVAEVDGQIAGHILFSPLAIVGAEHSVSALALAPMAVLPEYQKQGIGSQLVRQGLDACRKRGHRSVIVLGHAEYYPRFGFDPALARPLESPYAGEHFMALELEPGALAGVAGRVEYAPPFNEL